MLQNLLEPLEAVGGRKHQTVAHEDVGAEGARAVEEQRDRALRGRLRHALDEGAVEDLDVGAGVDRATTGEGALPRAIGCRGF